MDGTTRKLLKLRAAIESQAELIVELIDAALLELGEAAAPSACPDCGEAREELIEDTTPMESSDRPRMTCRSCGSSWYLEVSRRKEG